MKKILFFVFLIIIGTTNNIAKANNGWGDEPKLVAVSDDGGTATISYCGQIIQVNVVWPGRMDAQGIIIAPPVIPQSNSWRLGTNNQWMADPAYNEAEGMHAHDGKVYVVAGHRENGKMSFSGFFVSARWYQPLDFDSWMVKYKPEEYKAPDKWYKSVTVFLDEQYGLYTVKL